MTRKLHWLDYLLILAVVLATLFIWYRIDGVLNYKWRWEIIPHYLVRYDAEQGRWVANILLQGLISTVRICIYSGILALLLGLVLGVARSASNLTVRMLARTYVECLRNVPPVVIVFIFFFFLSDQIVTALNIEDWARGIARQEDKGIWEFFFGNMRHFPALVSGVIVLALFESAFVGEIIRAGIQSISKGQHEAAQSLGMSWIDQMRFIILPQALKRVIPPLANQFISLIKSSSFISLISIQELTFKTLELVATTDAIFEAWITTAALYFVLCFSLSLVFRNLERR
jgi:polar amino acid transport system permease protein